MRPAWTCTFGGTASTANGHNLGQLFTSTGMIYAAGPSFQWNILNYGQITNNVRLQDAKLQQLLVDYQVLKAQQEVDNGISTFLQSRVQVGYLRWSVEAASSALSASLVQYDQGFMKVLVNEQNLLQSQSNLAVSLSNVALGATAIYRALGGGRRIGQDSFFVTAATSDQIPARTNWGGLLPPAGQPQPPVPGLAGLENIGLTTRQPKW